MVPVGRLTDRHDRELSGTVRVGLLMHALDRPLNGVSRVALELGRALLSRDDCDVAFLTTYSRGPFADQSMARSVYLPGCGRVPGLMVFGGPMIALAARRLKLDVVHDPSGVSPFTLGRWSGSFRRLVTIHDAIAFRYPEGYSRSNNFLHRRYVPATLRHVDGVITVSDHAQADLQRFLGLTPDRLWVVPNGVSDAFQPVDSVRAEEVAAGHGLRRPYILYVGTRQPRKNVSGLIAAFQRVGVRLPGYQLAIVGPGVASDQPAAGGGRIVEGPARITYVGPVPDADLPALYSSAELFVLPSLFEGFGLPVLEAMACGTPVVCSNASSLPEVAGDAALLTDATDPDALSNAMWRVLTDATLAGSLRVRGLARARQFTWQNSAEQLVEVYRRVAAS